LQDDLKKVVSEPQPPPQEAKIPKEGKAKVNEQREIGEGDDTVIVEDTSNEDDDEETLQDRFQLRRGSAVPVYLMCPSFKTRQLAKRLVWLHCHGSRVTPPASE
jgi:hypothetical protein